MSEVTTNTCDIAYVLSWFYNLELSNQISIVGIIVSTITSIISFFLGFASLRQSKRYKKQADEFADTQFMPEFFVVGEHGYITVPENAEHHEVSSLGYGFSLGLGKFFAMKTPIYKLTISKVIIDGKHINSGEKIQQNTVDIFPTDPYFDIRISIPEGISTSSKHKGAVILTYESMYGVVYQKQVDFIFQKESSKLTIHSRDIKCMRAERCN